MCVWLTLSQKFSSSPAGRKLRIWCQASRVGGGVFTEVNWLKHGYILHIMIWYSPCSQKMLYVLSIFLYAHFTPHPYFRIILWSFLHNIRFFWWPICHSLMLGDHADGTKPHWNRKLIWGQFLHYLLSLTCNYKSEVYDCNLVAVIHEMTELRNSIGF